jgi:hypothetical protein
MWSVKIACDREDCEFIWVLAVVLDNAPMRRHCRASSADMTGFMVTPTTYIPPEASSWILIPLFP